MRRIASSHGGWHEVRARRVVGGRQPRATGARESDLGALVEAGLIELRSDGSRDVERGRTVLDRNWFARPTAEGVAWAAGRPEMRERRAGRGYVFTTPRHTYHAVRERSGYGDMQWVVDRDDRAPWASVGTLAMVRASILADRG